MSTVVDADLASWAARNAQSLLSSLGNRWRHVQGVVRLAYTVSDAFNEPEKHYLIAAAYLHDIGYAPALAKIGFHPVDGARFIRSAGYERVACLVAHHSEARFEAELRGFQGALAAFPRERSALADALTYCDQLTSPTGERISSKARIADIIARYGKSHVVSQAILQARPYLALAIARTERRLRAHGLLERVAQLK